MIHDVDESLGRLLAAELGRQPGCLVRDREQVLFERPAKVEAMQDGEARVNLYLYELRRNSHRNEVGRISVQPADKRDPRVGHRQAPVMMDLAYLVTAYAGNDPLVEHRLLSEILAALLRCHSVPSPYLTGALDGLGADAVLLSVANPEDEESQDVRSLWQALGGHMRPSLTLIATLPFDPSETVWKKRVREIVRVMGPGTQPGSSREAPAPFVAVPGIAVDQPTEQPLKGVAVTPLALDGEDDSPVAPPVRTDERGFFVVGRLRPGPVRLLFRCPGYRRQEERITIPERGRTDLLEPLVVALRPLDAEEQLRERTALCRTAGGDGGGAEAPARATLTGRLHFPDGRPAAYAPVWVGHRRAATDAQGFYAFSDMAPGECTVNAELPGVGVVQMSAQVPSAEPIAGQSSELPARGEEESAES